MGDRATSKNDQENRNKTDQIAQEGPTRQIIKQTHDPNQKKRHHKFFQKRHHKFFQSVQMQTSRVLLVLAIVIGGGGGGANFGVSARDEGDSVEDIEIAAHFALFKEVAFAGPLGFGARPQYMADVG